MPHMCINIRQKSLGGRELLKTGHNRTVLLVCSMDTCKFISILVHIQCNQIIMNIVDHRLLYKLIVHGKLTFIITGRNSVRNWSKLTDFVMRIELTWAILSPRLAGFQTNMTIHFRQFLYLITCYLRITVSLLCWSQTVPKIHVPIYPYI